VGSVLSVTTRLARRRVSSFLVAAAEADGRCTAGMEGVGTGVAWAAFTQAAMPSRRMMASPELEIGSAPSTAARSRS
jgi:hypothetical protein